MDNCTHGAVCGYKKESPCNLQPICKHAGDEKPKKQQVKESVSRGPHKSSKVNLDPNDKKDITKARQELSRLKKLGRLDDSQLRALASTEGISFKKMSEAHKNQIINMLDDLRD